MGLAPGGAELVAAITGAGGQAIFVRCDVSKEADCKTMVDAAVAKWGRLDGAFNNAGVSPNLRDITDSTADAEAAFNMTFDINVKGFSWKHPMLRGFLSPRFWCNRGTSHVPRDVRRPAIAPKPGASIEDQNGLSLAYSWARVVRISAFKTDRASVHSVYESSLPATGVMFCMRHQIPAMIRTAGAGAIVNNASVHTFISVYRRL